MKDEQQNKEIETNALGTLKMCLRSRSRVPESVKKVVEEEFISVKQKTSRKQKTKDSKLIREIDEGCDIADAEEPLFERENEDEEVEEEKESDLFEIEEEINESEESISSDSSYEEENTRKSRKSKLKGSNRRIQRNSEKNGSSSYKNAFKSRGRIKKEDMDSWKNFSNVEYEEIEHYEIDVLQYLRDMCNKLFPHDIRDVIISEAMQMLDRDIHINVRNKKDNNTNNKVAEDVSFFNEETLNVQMNEFKNKEDLRNIFFFKSILIDLNGARIEVSPFSSAVVSKNDLDKHKGSRFSSKSKRGRIVNDSDQMKIDKTKECNSIIKLQISEDKKDDKKCIYINEEPFDINHTNVLSFLYLLLVCSYLFAEDIADRIDRHLSSRNKGFNLQYIRNRMKEESFNNLSMYHTFINVSSPIVSLDFSSTFNISYLLDSFLREQGNENKSPSSNSLIQNFISECKIFFSGSLLAISTSGYLENSMIYKSNMKCRSFTFIYFISKFIKSPILVYMIEHDTICRKVQWIKEDVLFTGKDKNDETANFYTPLLICMLGNQITVYGIPQYQLLVQFLSSVKEKSVNKDSLENLLKIKAVQLYTYNNNKVLTDFSYTVCLKNRKKYLKLALCCNEWNVKIINVTLDFVSERISKNSIASNPREAKIRFDEMLKNTQQEILNLEEEQKGILMQKRFSECPLELIAKEELIHLEQGKLFLCTFFPCVNSYILCISSYEGNIFIIDSRNNNELFFYKRKTETVTHLKWNNNSCISFGQDKGTILHLYEQRQFINIDKIHVSPIEVLCLDSILYGNHFAFTFDDGTALFGELRNTKKKSSTFNELFLWTCEEYQIDGQMLFDIFRKKESIEDVGNSVFLYEYLKSMWTIFKSGIQIERTTTYKNKYKRKKPVPLKLTSISSLDLGKDSIIAYGSCAGIIHLSLYNEDT